MEEMLIESLRKCLANTFVFYFKTHAFHWNVEGINFPVYHDFFGKLYEDLHGAVDPIAEEIRALGVYAPTSLPTLYNDSDINDNDSITGNSLKEMLSSALEDNTVMLNCLNTSFNLASELNQQGLADFLAGRIDIHKKHEWMIRSCLKGA